MNNILFSDRTMLNITFTRMEGQKIDATIQDKFTMGDFKRLIEEKIGQVDDFRFIIQSKELQMNNENVFNQSRHLITNGVIIFVLKRLNGGSYGYEGIAKLTEKIQSAL